MPVELLEKCHLNVPAGSLRGGRQHAFRLLRSARRHSELRPLDMLMFTKFRVLFVSFWGGGGWGLRV